MVYYSYKNWPMNQCNCLINVVYEIDDLAGNWFLFIKYLIFNWAWNEYKLSVVKRNRKIEKNEKV